MQNSVKLKKQLVWQGKKKDKSDIGDNIYINKANDKYLLKL